MRTTSFRGLSRRETIHSHQTTVAAGARHLIPSAAPSSTSSSSFEQIVVLVFIMGSTGLIIACEKNYPI
ncbi:hypothetical protein AKJ16_DCAP13486 [Drosera capensis]